MTDEFNVPPILTRNIRQQMDEGKLVSSVAVRLVNGPEIAYLAKTAGFDSLYIDLKHSSLSLEATRRIAEAAMAVGVTPLARPVSNDPDDIAHTLDSGPLGVIAAQVRSIDELRSIVRATKFQPAGERSVSSTVPQLGYQSVPLGEANRILNDATMVIMVLETVEALEQVDEMAAVDGLDVILMGTNDLSAELGVPGQGDHPKIREAYEKAQAACAAHGKHLGVGGLSSRPDLVAEYAALGARFVSTGTDIGFLLGAMKAKAAAMREAPSGASKA